MSKVMSFDEWSEWIASFPFPAPMDMQLAYKHYLQPLLPKGEEKKEEEVTTLHPIFKPILDSFCKPKESENINCPFCGETNFDEIGLKHHLSNYCEKYSQIQNI